MNENDIDRRKLMIDALAQTKSIERAVALVERVLELAGPAETPLLALPPPAPPPAPPPLATHAVKAPKPRGAASHLTHKPWTQDDITQANRMLALGRSNAEVGKVLGRSDKAITSALSRGVIEAPDSPQRERGRKMAYLNALNRGRNLKDYDKAEAVLGPMIKPEPELRVANGVDVEEAISLMTF